MITPFSLKLIPFFHSFEDLQLKAICPYVIQKKYLADEFILQQNRTNTKLYFLISGSACVLVNDQVILEISQVGEVFGEMSLANHSACTASVKTTKESEFFVLSFEDMRKGLDPALKDGILKNFYKGAMEILASKLISTNKRHT